MSRNRIMSENDDIYSEPTIDPIYDCKFIHLSIFVIINLIFEHIVGDGADRYQDLFNEVEANSMRKNNTVNPNIGGGVGPG